MFILITMKSPSNHRFLRVNVALFFPGAQRCLFDPDTHRWAATGQSPRAAGGGLVVLTPTACAAWRENIAEISQTYGILMEFMWCVRDFYDFSVGFVWGRKKGRCVVFIIINQNPDCLVILGFIWKL